MSFGYVRGMSTRMGEAVWLEAVLDEARDRATRFRVQRAEASARGAIGLAPGEADAVSEAVGQAALLYFDVSSRRMTDLSFDWDAVLQFEGNTGPYLQYAHARMSGIFRKAGELGLRDESSRFHTAGGSRTARRRRRGGRPGRHAGRGRPASAAEPRRRPGLRQGRTLPALRPTRHLATRGQKGQP